MEPFDSVTLAHPPIARLRSPDGALVPSAVTPIPVVITELRCSATVRSVRTDSVMLFNSTVVLFEMFHHIIL